MTKETIIKVVCDYFGTTWDEVLKTKTCRKREFVMVRYFIFKQLKENTKLSLSEIGAELNKDHATVLFGLKSINNLIETDPLIEKKYKNVSELLKYSMFNYESIANY